MTLNTHIVATTPCDAHDIFHEFRRLLGCTDAHTFKDEPAAEWHDEEGLWQILNDGGQGLPGWLWVYYRPGLEPRRTPEEHERCEDWCDEDCDHTSHPPVCWVEVTIDTAYGYHHDGEGCGDLHARLVYELGQWFDERKIGWGWQNEFTGEWHYEDRYKALRELCSDGGRAMAWFVEMVQPTIEAATGGRCR